MDLLDALASLSVEADDSEPFWSRLSWGHRIAYLGSCAALLGAWGFWDSVTIIPFLLGFPRTLGFMEPAGWAMAACAIASFTVLSLRRLTPSARTRGVVTAMGLLAALAAWKLMTLDLPPDVGLSWGLPLALGGSLVAVVAALLGNRPAPRQMA
ncbi:MAG TPA: hypothetical protein VNZ52_08100 [Candidatus Thermoplasmatota archaeon]|nr:hypothetical protein [Candidatus Thermoplasmatota archaeon]